VAWDWSYRVGTGAPFLQTTTGAVFANPGLNCSLFPAPPLPAGGNLWLPLTVTLKVHDDQGNVSVEVSNNGGARVFPQGACGY
jgi:hypothetical protein